MTERLSIHSEEGTEHRAARLRPPEDTAARVTSECPAMFSIGNTVVNRVQLLKGGSTASSSMSEAAVLPR